MDTLQLLTLSVSGRCAFSVLTLVVPHLLPPGSFAILFDGRHWLPFPPLCIIDASENVDSLLLLFFFLS